MELDRIDIAMLEHLQPDGRATTVELSEAVGLSPSPCHRRQKPAGGGRRDRALRRVA